MNIYTFNVQGLPTKYACLTDLLSEYNPDTVKITETYKVPNEISSTHCHMCATGEIVLSDYLYRTCVHPA